MKPTFFKMLALYLCLGHFASAKVIDDLKKSSKCTYSKHENSQYNCEFKVGNDLHIEIAGVGDKDASVYFWQVSKAKYIAKFLISSQCVMVKNAKGDVLDFAFISVKTGQIYSDWAICPKM